MQISVSSITAGMGRYWSAQGSNVAVRVAGEGGCCRRFGQGEPAALTGPDLPPSLYICCRKSNTTGNYCQVTTGGEVVAPSASQARTSAFCSRLPTHPSFLLSLSPCIFHSSLENFLRSPL